MREDRISGRCYKNEGRPVELITGRLKGYKGFYGHYDPNGSREKNSGGGEIIGRHWLILYSKSNSQYKSWFHEDQFIFTERKCINMFTKKDLQPGDWVELRSGTWYQYVQGNVVVGRNNDGYHSLSTMKDDFKDPFYINNSCDIIQVIRPVHEYDFAYMNRTDGRVVYKEVQPCCITKIIVHHVGPCSPIDPTGAVGAGYTGPSCQPPYSYCAVNCCSPCCGCNCN